MADNRPDPGEFFEMAQRMLRDLFGEQRSGEQRSGGDPWAEATRRPRERSESRELSPAQQRENLTFALATRGVEALEDLALNVAAIRQRLERMDTQASGASGGDERDTREDPTPPGSDPGGDPT